jgi:Ser/Thr protein kinase RdoA (MazF antagonist)
MQPIASPIQSAISSAGQSSGVREKFALDELAVVLSYYDTGVLESASEFARGSRRAPKMLLSGPQGKFVLKRRAKGKDDPFKVAFCHSVQLYLASKQFPLPRLLGTRKDNNSMLQMNGAIYELFEYIPGQPYPNTLEASFEAGRVLGLMHKLLLDLQTDYKAPTGSYHQQNSLIQALAVLPQALGAQTEDLAAAQKHLGEAYRRAAEQVEQRGIRDWARQFVHGDWHPGNMLFRDEKIVAVLDYDSARLLPRALDVANGALQFGMVGGDEDVSRWPDHLDEPRFKRFVRGYDQVMLLSEAEIQALPWLMIEALVAEAVLPIAMSGSFGVMDGMAFLRMVRRKVHWLVRNAERLVNLVEA